MKYVQPLGEDPEKIDSDMKVVLNKVYHADNAKFTPQIPDRSLDVILEDPPYLYLKNQKLDRPFDELAHFTECYRMLREGGFIVLFGRGESFYRWNTILAQLGFEFKEEIIWDKKFTSSPLHSISRVHETITIWSKGKAKINKVKVPYLEMKEDNIESICMDIKRMRNILGNPKSLASVQHYLESGYLKPKYNREELSTTVSSKIKTADVNASVMRAINEGMNEKTIIPERFERYHTIHPTQKPPRLLERLLALVIPQDKPLEEIKVANFFGGSCNTAKACIAMGVNYIITEIDKEYFDLGVDNVEQFKREYQPQLF